MKHLFAFSMLAIFLASCTPSKVVSPPTPAPTPIVRPVMSNGIDSFSYALGASVAKSLKMQGADTINMEAFSKGMNDNFYNDTSLLNDQLVDKTIREKLQFFMNQKLEKAKADGTSFLEKNKTQPGITVLPNGIQYKVIKMGTGAKPLETDRVVVHYAGKLINGEEFDSSIKRGEPATFGMTEVVKGWTEILKLMPKGSRWEVYIPSDLAYGDRGRGPVIPPAATLIFDMELIDVLAN